jgi:hypothetical protein
MTGNFLNKVGLKFAVATAIAGAALTLSGSAAAEASAHGGGGGAGAAAAGGAAVDWSKVVYDLDQYVRGNSGGTEMLAPMRMGHASSSPVDDDKIDARHPEHAWFGIAPRLTLVARDWNGSMRLAGDRLSLVDSMRLSASTRMVVGRARLSSTRFAPFVQVGVGQWRVDRTYMPLTPLSTEVASQLGGGFELRLAKHWHAAVEGSCISLLREGTRFEQNQLWNAFLASRIDF